MHSNKLRMAIRSTAAVAILGVAAQAGAADFNAGGYDMSVYGYARYNASYDLDNAVTQYGTRSGSFGLINTNDAALPEGVFGSDAVQSRIGVSATTPEGVKVVVEGDFRPGTLRLRHAYGEYNGVMAGQNWSNFTSFVGNTATLDFDSLPGLAGNQGRTAQVRYTTGPMSFSVEQPNASVLNSGARKVGSPAITARLQDSADGMSYSAAVLAQQLGVDDGTNDDTAVGFAAFVAAKMAVTDMITVQGTLSFSDGSNSYLYRSGEDFGAASAYVSGTGLETISGYGGSVGAGINLGGGSSVNIGYGIVEVDWDDAERDLGAAAVAGESESNSMIIANYMWTPVKNTMMGVELQNLSRENVNGDDGDATRILFAAQYNF